MPTSTADVFLSFYHSSLPWFEVVSVLLTIFFVLAIIYIAAKTGWFEVRVDRFQDIILKKDKAKTQILESWDDVQEHFFAGDDNDLKIAIIEADNVLDDALRRVGVQGMQLGDRLKKVRPEQIPNIDEVWQAHKLRNQIAHEANFKMNRDLAERALDIYEKALRSLGVFDKGPAAKKPPAADPSDTRKSHH